MTMHPKIGVGDSLLFFIITLRFFLFHPVFVATAQTENPLLTIWQLAYWENSETACTILTGNNGFPSPEEILDSCGSSILHLWQTTPACNNPFEKSDADKSCSGLFFRKTGQRYRSESEFIGNTPNPKPANGNIQLEVLNCTPGSFCDVRPVILFRKISSENNDLFPKIRVRINFFEGECSSENCQMELPVTGEKGEWLEYWAMASDGGQGIHNRVKFRVLENWNNTGEYRFDLISESYPDTVSPGSDLWKVFPSMERFQSKILEIPYSPEYLTTTHKLSILAGKLIQKGFADISRCENFGLMADGSANGCGEMASSELVFTWQNQYNEQLFSAGKKYQVPPRIIKSIITQESQFWPDSNISHEYGLGMITESGADLLLRWNPVYFQPLCNEIFAYDPERCKSGFSGMLEKDQIILRGSALQKIGTDDEIDLLAATLKASAAQVNQLVQNVTGLSIEEVATYEDMWRFTIANYYSGSGCLQSAMQVTFALKYSLTWENVRNFLSGSCSNAKEYVDRVYFYGN